MRSFLSDGVISLRAVEHEDIDLLMEWENDSSEWLSSVNIAPYSRSQMTAYVESYTADIARDRQLRLMINRVFDHATVGMVDLFDYDPVNRRAAVGIFVSRDARRTGVAGRALDIAVRYAGKRLMLNQLSAVIPVDNVASSALFAKAGFTESGCLREWFARADTSTGYVDALICQILL